MQIIKTLWGFFERNFPCGELILWLFPLLLIWSFLALFLAGYCKKYYNLKTGYSRKLFHFFIFGTAFLCQQYVGLPGVFVLGWAVTATLIYITIQGEGYILYEALAREIDAPHRTKYIFLSYLATLFGGLLSNIYFRKFAIFGYAITGIADALAEPAGILFGKHYYRVWSIHPDKTSQRSLEGIMTVLLTSLLVYYTLCNALNPGVITIMKLAIVAVICAFTEAISPSGFDNLLLQVVASGLASCILTAL